MAVKKQGINKQLLIIGGVVIALLVLIIAYGYSASQKNKQLAAQTAAYNAAKEAKAKADAARQADLDARYEKQQQQWGKLSPEQQEKASLDHRFEQTRIAREKEETASDTKSIPMSFSDCKSRLSASMLAVAENYKTDLIVNSGEMVMGRICTNDGSVLITCSKPDGKMITKKSGFTGCT